MDWQWQEFVKFQQVGVRHQRDVHDEGELQGLGIEQVGNLHLKKVRGVVHEGDHVPLSGHGQGVFQDFVQDIMGKSPWSQSLMLSRFDNIFVVMHN